MPVYNVKEEYLRESIESILNQTFKDFEFIILDDCSENDVEAIVKSYKDERIKFYRNAENKNVAFCRNKLLDLCRSEYAAFQDADDISYPERLKLQVDYLDRYSDVSILSAGYETIPENLIVRNCQNVKYLDLFKYCCVAQPVLMLRITDIRQYNLRYNEDFVTSEDYELWARAINYLKIVNMPNILLKYRVRPNSLSHGNIELAMKNDKFIREQMLDFLTSDISLKKSIKNLVFQQFVYREN